MVQCLKALAVLPRDPGSDPSTLLWLTSTCDSSCRGYNALFRNLHIHALRNTYVHTI